MPGPAAPLARGPHPAIAERSAPTAGLHSCTAQIGQAKGQRVHQLRRPSRISIGQRGQKAGDDRALNIGRLALRTKANGLHRFAAHDAAPGQFIPLQSRCRDIEPGAAQAAQENAARLTPRNCGQPPVRRRKFHLLRRIPVGDQPRRVIARNRCRLPKWRQDQHLARRRAHGRCARDTGGAPGDHDISHVAGIADQSGKAGQGNAAPGKGDRRIVVGQHQLIARLDRPQFSGGAIASPQSRCSDRRGHHRRHPQEQRAEHPNSPVSGAVCGGHGGHFPSASRRIGDLPDDPALHAPLVGKAQNPRKTAKTICKAQKCAGMGQSRPSGPPGTRPNANGRACDIDGRTITVA